jgi:2-dehydro-3-deoxygluconokinase
LKEKFPNAKKIITTLRGSTNANYNTWSGILYNGKDFYTAPVYNITDIVDRVGSGDSFMAGLIYGLMTWPEDDEKALHFATAASCLKHTIHGDANLVSIDEVNKLMSGDQSGRVSR